MSSATTGLEGLRFLKDQLSQKKDQLAALVAECEGKLLLVLLITFFTTTVKGNIRRNFD